MGYLLRWWHKSGDTRRAALRCLPVYVQQIRICTRTLSECHWLVLDRVQTIVALRCMIAIAQRVGYLYST